jgi:four helix bundle protein
VLANQIAKCGTSVAANYRAACKGRSKSEFIAKLGIVEEEADESQFWVEMVMEANLFPTSRLSSLHKEVRELTAIFAASRKTASRR